MARNLVNEGYTTINNLNHTLYVRRILLVECTATLAAERERWAGSGNHIGFVSWQAWTPIRNCEYWTVEPNPLQKSFGICSRRQRRVVSGGWGALSFSPIPDTYLTGGH